MGGWLDVWPDSDNKALNWPTGAELGKILNIRQILRKLQIPKITKNTKIQLGLQKLKIRKSTLYKATTDKLYKLTRSKISPVQILFSREALKK